MLGRTGGSMAGVPSPMSSPFAQLTDVDDPPFDWTDIVKDSSGASFSHHRG